MASKIGVALLGGFAMVPKHMKNYKKLYSDLGANTVIPFCDSSYNYSNVRRVEPVGQRRLKQMEQFKEDRLVIHLFSGHYWVFHSMIDNMPEEMRQRIAGIVFESTPMDNRAEQFGRFLAWKFGQEYSEKWSWPFIPYRIFANIPQWEAAQRDRMHKIIPQHSKVMMLHANTDPIASPDYINNYADLLQGEGVDVSRFVLPDGSTHCAAIRDHPQLYASVVREFWEQKIVGNGTPFGVDFMDENASLLPAKDAELSDEDDMMKERVATNTRRSAVVVPV